jgi:hypothetical protein
MLKLERIRSHAPAKRGKAFNASEREAGAIGRSPNERRQ